MNIYHIILWPVESQKARELELTGVYTFRIANDATKTDVKNAFHTLYDRTVGSIQIAKNYSKTKNGRKGAIRRRAAFKKAYVTLDKPVTQLAKLHLSKD